MSSVMSSVEMVAQRATAANLDEYPFRIPARNVYFGLLCSSEDATKEEYIASWQTSIP